jgi:hypothetical protein
MVIEMFPPPELNVSLFQGINDFKEIAAAAAVSRRAYYARQQPSPFPNQ